MLSTLKLRTWKPQSASSLKGNCVTGYLSSCSPAPASVIRLPRRHMASLPLQSHDSTLTTSPLTSAVGSSPSSPHLAHSKWILTQRHILLLNIIACAAAISAAWVFICAILSVLESSRVTGETFTNRKDLPDTMTAVRLSGMEISDLTTELSDLSQEITLGVRNSTQAVRSLEEMLRWLKNIGPSGGCPC